ncbi:MAG: FIST N-terminal domain-containing protein [Alphaproteobacteria bacterium]
MATPGMVRVSCGGSRLPDGADAARELAMQAGRGLGRERARAAVFFATSDHGPSLGRFEMAIRAATGAAAIVGCSASGVLWPGGEAERGPAVTALAIAGDFEVRRFFLPGLRGRADEVGREIGREASMLERGPRTILLLADSYALAPDELLAGIEGIARDAVVIGAGASESGQTGETRVVAGGRCASDAVAGLVLGGVRVRTTVSLSCAIVGGWRTVTSCSGNRILALDGEPALPVYLECLPASLREELRDGLRATLAALAPPGDAVAASDSWVVRPVIGADPRDDSLLVGDEVLPGTRFAIAVRDAAVAREGLDADLERLRTGGPGLAGALYFAGAERGESLFGHPDVESAYLARGLGETPLAGLFCGAEFAPRGGRNRFHQHAGVLVGLERG